ncbi:MAG: hypothetical protein A2075_11660 [Geobacteraceae bacterium GWC2_58_44]|nr:MAG: hypothetical protein A2075_11660 [Geobacteraceae bacterium GWC2_58_44]HBG08300.1 hypothetical protein [Geobacter sp.]
MFKLRAGFRYLLAASAITACLSACGGSDSSSSAAAVSTQAASWTDVSVRGLDGAVNINWDRAADAPWNSTYNIYCSGNPAGIVRESNRIATNYHGRSFDHTNVTNGERYYYVVTEVTATGEGPASRLVSATPQAVQPATPSALKLTLQDSSIKLELTGPTPPNPALASYNLYRSTARNSFTSGNRIASAATLPYLDGSANLAPGTTYYYAVTAVVAGKESRFSPAVSARPQAEIAAVAATPTRLAAFASPTGMSIQPGNGSCLVGWSDVDPLESSSSDPAPSGAAEYVLYWSDVPEVLDNAKWRIDSAAKDATSGALEVTGLSNGVMYYFQLVAAVKGSDGNPIPGRFTAGPVLSVTPAPRSPAIPSGVAATQGSRQVSLAWNRDGSGISGVTYNVYFSETDTASPGELMAQGSKKQNADGSKTYYTHTGLQPGKTYYYVVTSVADGGESAPSSIVSVTL